MSGKDVLILMALIFGMGGTAMSVVLLLMMRRNSKIRKSNEISESAENAEKDSDEVVEVKE